MTRVSSIRLQSGTEQGNHRRIVERLFRTGASQSRNTQIRVKLYRRRASMWRRARILSAYRQISGTRNCAHCMKEACIMAATIRVDRARCRYLSVCHHIMCNIGLIDEVRRKQCIRDICTRVGSVAAHPSRFVSSIGFNIRVLQARRV